MMSSYLILTSTLSSLLLLCSAADPVVYIERSKIQGLRTDLPSGRQVHKYLGIRYAQAPIGPRRFRLPTKADLPAHVDATRYGARCPQYPLLNTGMSEDCLFLNVFTPPGPSTSIRALRLPVLVWIHGGGFITGSADLYEGDVLASEGEIVVVTVNYRLGALGFLYTGDEAAEGNYGLWDQRLALKWVQAYIRHFGGDEGRVTLAGMSAGGASAAFHSLSPLSRDLFRHVVQLSGSASSPWARVSGEEAREAALALGQRLGCNSQSPAAVNDTGALLQCLRRQRIERLVLSSTVLFPHKVALSLVTFTWAPVKDGLLVKDMDRVTAFAGPLMAGLVNNEGDSLVSWIVPRVSKYIVDTRDLLGRRQFFSQQLLPTLLKQAYPALVHPEYPTRHAALGPGFEHPPVSRALSSLECAYLATRTHKDQRVGDTELREVFGDQAFVLGTVRHLQQFCTYQPSFLYYLTHQSGRPGVAGTRHTDDLAFLFGFNSTIAQLLGFKGHVTSLDLQLARDFRRLFFNFIKTGDPNSPERPANWPLWSPYTAKGANYLVLSNSPRVLSHLKADKMALWLEELPRVLASEGNSSEKWHCHVASTSSSDHCLFTNYYHVVVLSVWLFFACLRGP